MDYLELDKCGCDRILIKASAIWTVEPRVDGCEINDRVRVRQTYDQVKRMIRSDPRRFVCDNEIDFRVRALKHVTVREICRRLPGEAARQFIIAMMSATDEYELERFITEQMR